MKNRTQRTKVASSPRRQCKYEDCDNYSPKAKTYCTTACACGAHDLQLIKEHNEKKVRQEVKNRNFAATYGTKTSREAPRMNLEELVKRKYDRCSQVCPICKDKKQGRCLGVVGHSGALHQCHIHAWGTIDEYRRDQEAARSLGVYLRQQKHRHALFAMPYHMDSKKLTQLIEETMSPESRERAHQKMTKLLDRLLPKMKASLHDPRYSSPPSGMTLKELVKLIKIRAGGANYSIDEITGSFNRLLKYVGKNPEQPDNSWIGMDLIYEAIYQFCRDCIERQYIPLTVDYPAGLFSEQAGGKKIFDWSSGSPGPACICTSTMKGPTMLFNRNPHCPVHGTKSEIQDPLKGTGYKGCP